MITKLEKTLRRELQIRGRAYVLTIDEDGLKLTLKGHRNGQELRWDAFASGDAAFAVALNASLAQANDEDAGRPPPAAKRVKSAKRPKRRSR